MLSQASSRLLPSGHIQTQRRSEVMTFSAAMIVSIVISITTSYAVFLFVLIMKIVTFTIALTRLFVYLLNAFNGELFFN